MTLRDVLLRFQCQEISHVWEDFRVFYTDHSSPTSGESSAVEFFKFFPSTATFEISGTRYNSEDDRLLDVLDTKLRSLSDPQNYYSDKKSLYSELENSRLQASLVKFDEEFELNQLQVSISDSGGDPTKLEDFTDWLVDYLAATQFWQVRYSAKIYRVSCVDQKIEHVLSEGCTVEEKVFKFVETDAFQSGYWIKLRLRLFCDEEDSTSVKTLNDSYDEAEVFFHDGERAIDPSKADSFDLWYSHLVEGNDPFEDNED